MSRSSSTCFGRAWKNISKRVTKPDEIVHKNNSLSELTLLDRRHFTKISAGINYGPNFLAVIIFGSELRCVNSE